IGGTLPWHPCRPSPVHMLDSTHERGCLSQSLSLLAASRRRHHGLAARSPWFQLTGIHLQPAFAASVHTCDQRRSASCLLSGVGRGDDSTLRCVSIGSCPSTVPCSAWKLILA